MIICRSLRRERLPFRFLIPVHIVINVARSVIKHAAPYTHIPFNTVSKFVLPFLIKICMAQDMINMNVFAIFFFFPLVEK